MVQHGCRCTIGFQGRASQGRAVGLCCSGVMSTIGFKGREAEGQRKGVGRCGIGVMSITGCYGRGYSGRAVAASKCRLACRGCVREGAACAGYGAHAATGVRCGVLADGGSIVAACCRSCLLYRYAAAAAAAQMRLKVPVLVSLAVKPTILMRREFVSAPCRPSSLPTWMLWVCGALMS